MNFLREFIKRVLRETYVGKNYPYRTGTGRKGPGFGFGTGMGGFNYVMRPNRNMGAEGGNLIKNNPLKPYSDEFTDYLSTQKKQDWDVEVKNYLDGIQKLRSDIKSANSQEKLEDIISSVSSKYYAEELTKEVVIDYGVYEDAKRNDNLEKMKMMLISGFEEWARENIQRAHMVDYVDSLEDITYKGIKPELE